MDTFLTKKFIDPKQIVWSTSFAIVGVVVILINALALYIFITTASLKTRRHVMIINLTVTDLLFGAAGINSTLFYVLKPSDIAFYVCLVLNMVFKMASLSTLGVIALERMHAIIWPIRHHVLGKKIYKNGLLLIWLVSAVIIALVIFNLVVVKNPGSPIGVVFPIVLFGITVMIITCYVSIWISVRRRNGQKLDGLSKQNKALAVTLLLVAGAFVVTWVTPMLYIAISRMCKSCHKPSATELLSIHLVFALQSVINPVIYCFRMPEFKAGLKKQAQKTKCLGIGKRMTESEREMARTTGNETERSGRVL